MDIPGILSHLLTPVLLISFIQLRHHDFLEASTRIQSQSPTTSEAPSFWVGPEKGLGCCDTDCSSILPRRFCTGPTLAER